MVVRSIVSKLSIPLLVLLVDSLIFKLSKLDPIRGNERYKNLNNYSVRRKGSDQN